MSIASITGLAQEQMRRYQTPLEAAMGRFLSNPSNLLPSNLTRGVQGLFSQGIQAVDRFVSSNEFQSGFQAYQELNSSFNRIRDVINSHQIRP